VLVEVAIQSIWVPAKFYSFAIKVRNQSTANYTELKSRISKSTKLIGITYCFTLLVTGLYIGYAVLATRQGILEQEFARHFGVLNCAVWPLIYYFISESIDSVIKVRFINFNQLDVAAKVGPKDIPADADSRNVTFYSFPAG
jgi:hypothetical protein